jgi:UDP-N-acetylmuramate--alanine ligase
MIEHTENQTNDTFNPKSNRDSMYKVDFNNAIHVHFIGIGGISMSGLAEILIDRGFTVSGSDISNSSTIEKLIPLGAKIHLSHNASNITKDIDLIVYTAAIKNDNVEFMEGKSLGIPLIDRATLLGQVMSNYKYPVGVSGTHGKTTTTSMLSHILLEGKKDPTISVGGILNLINGNIRIGASDYFITEACEYCDSFLKFFPYIELILNIEEDHLDYFSGISHIRNSFKKYGKNVPSDGYVIINSDIDNYEEIVADLDCNIVTFGTKKNKSDYYPVNITYNEKGIASFDLYNGNNFIDKITLNVTGVHNIYNSLAAIVAGLILNISVDDIKTGLLSFGGTNRRFEYKGSLKGITVIDDYAHHPTEIKATLTAAKNMDFNKLWVIFQPHTYSRTKAFLKEFAHSLTLADGIVVTDIYSAREKDPGDIHSKDLIEEIKLLDKKCYYFSSFDEIEIFILENCVPKDLLITMGAGNIYLIGDDLLSS